MITITKERLLTIKQWRETYGPGSNVVLPAEEAEELARIALASLEAEPIAWMRDDADGREYNARNEFSGGGGRSSTLRHPSSASSDRGNQYDPHNAARHE